MPLWNITHPSGTFEDAASQQALSRDITKIYTSVGLPAFYVVVNFIKLPPNNIWVGGETHSEKPFIRLQIDQIAVRLRNEDSEYKRITDKVDQVLKPHIADKGYDWEYHIDETERRLWKINGIAPPPHPSEGEAFWAKENRAIPWEDKFAN